MTGAHVAKKRQPKAQFSPTSPHQTFFRTVIACITDDFSRPDPEKKHDFEFARPVGLLQCRNSRPLFPAALLKAL
jgi:hypothetical protein